MKVTIMPHLKYLLDHYGYLYNFLLPPIKTINKLSKIVDLAIEKSACSSKPPR